MIFHRKNVLVRVVKNVEYEGWGFDPYTDSELGLDGYQKLGKIKEDKVNPNEDSSKHIRFDDIIEIWENNGSKNQNLLYKK